MEYELVVKPVPNIFNVNICQDVGFNVVSQLQ